MERCLFMMLRITIIRSCRARVSCRSRFAGSGLSLSQRAEATIFCEDSVGFRGQGAKDWSPAHSFAALRSLNGSLRLGVSLVSELLKLAIFSILKITSRRIASEPWLSPTIVTSTLQFTRTA